MAITAVTAITRNPHIWLSRACLAACLLLQGLVGHAATLQQQLDQPQQFAVPAQGLASALLEFAQQAGLQISVDSTLLEERRSPGVNGTWPTAQALQQLLKGSGLRWRVNTANSLTLEPEPPSASDASALQMPESLVLGKPEHDFLGEAVVDRRAIENFPGANGDLTSLLKMHPSVRFDSTQQSSNTPGEITPADISINGAKFYQNNFMIDGVSINNDLDPAASSASRNTYNGIYSLPSNAFGIATDADLLEEVRVYDSNVPAQYGRFNGGVVDAITRRPREGLHGKLSAQMSKSDWTEYHLNTDDISAEEFALSSDFSHQPEFKKLTTRIMLEGMLSENFGLIGNVVRKTSEIPLYAYEGGFLSPTDTQKHTQERSIENYMLKGFWTPSEQLDINFSLLDAPASGDYFKANQRDSAFRIDQGGQLASLQAVWNSDLLTYTHKFTYKTVQTSRDADSNTYLAWRWSDVKNWGNPFRDGQLSSSATSQEGGMGDLEQRQSGFEYSLDAALLPLDFAGSEHTLSSGLELRRQHASYEVLEDSFTGSALQLITASAATRCTTSSGALDERLCSIGTNPLGIRQRQFFRQLNYYTAGEIEVDQADYALYLQDEMRIGNLNLRPGLRLDGDDYMDKRTLAPRLATSYDFFADQSSVLSAGLNRYYGRNLFKYRLADGRESLRYRASRAASSGNSISEFGAMTQSGVDESSFRQLDIPYDDEWMLGFAQELAGMRWELKYVNRDGHDQVVRSRASYLGLEPGDGDSSIANYYTYTNAGNSRSKTLTLTVTALQPLHLAGTSTSVQFGADWNETQSAYSDYESLFNEASLDDQDVYYDGKLLPYSELPANNFNRPWTLRLNTSTSLPALNLTWSNFLRYRGPYEQIYQGNPETITLNGVVYDYYQVGEVSAAPSWDTRLKWDLPLAAEQSAYIAVDITNVTDQVNDILNDSGTLSYEVGRQYWLEVGYQF